MMKNYPIKVNWDEYQFRCSSLGKLMTNGRAKNSIGDTAISYLREIYLKEVWGFKQTLKNKYLEKGNRCEQDGINMLCDEIYNGEFLAKNIKHFSNEFINGTPDLLVQNVVYDIFDEDVVHDTKMSWDIFTFSSSKMTKIYEFQLRGYMWLTDVSKAQLNYCLVSIPDDMLDREINSACWNEKVQQGDERYDDVINQVKLNFNVDRIPQKQRIKTFKIERDKEIENQIIERIKVAREILKTMSV